MSRSAFAAAKVNLFLHVGAVRADGFLPVCSLMAFADIGDRLRLETAGAPVLAVEGPFAADLAGLGRVRQPGPEGCRSPRRRAPAAAVALEQGPAGGLGPRRRLQPTPAAALRLVRAASSACRSTTRALEAVAAAAGLGRRACLWGGPVVAEGRGERLSPAPRLPVLPAVLVNPRVACPTGAAYRRFDAAPRRPAGRPSRPAGGASTPREAAWRRPGRLPQRSRGARRRPGP